MTVSTEAVERLMKRCQIGVGGRNALDTAHDILAECYGTLGALVQERDRLLRGEHICRRCGLRKDGERDSEPLQGIVCRSPEEEKHGDIRR